MQKNQVGSYLLIGIAVIVLLVIISVITMEMSSKEINSIQLAHRWLLLLVGLTTIIFSLIKLLAAGAADITTELFSKWIILILLGMLIIESSKYLVLSIAIILAAMIILNYLKVRNKVTEASGQ